MTAKPNDPNEIRYAVPNGNFTGQANDGEAKWSTRLMRSVLSSSVASKIKSYQAAD